MKKEIILNLLSFIAIVIVAFIAVLLPQRTAAIIFTVGLLISAAVLLCLLIALVVVSIIVAIKAIKRRNTGTL